jgi:hypothetical protein
MDAWSEKQIGLLTQHSTALAQIERECLEMGLGDVCDTIYAARQSLTPARAPALHGESRLKRIQLS